MAYCVNYETELNGLTCSTDSPEPFVSLMKTVLDNLAEAFRKKVRHSRRKYLRQLKALISNNEQQRLSQSSVASKSSTATTSTTASKRRLSFVSSLIGRLFRRTIVYDIEVKTPNSSVTANTPIAVGDKATDNETNPIEAAINKSATDTTMNIDFHFKYDKAQFGPYWEHLVQSVIADGKNRKFHWSKFRRQLKDRCDQYATRIWLIVAETDRAMSDAVKTGAGYTSEYFDSGNVRVPVISLTQAAKLAGKKLRSPMQQYVIQVGEIFRAEKFKVELKISNEQLRLDAERMHRPFVQRSTLEWSWNLLTTSIAALNVDISHETSAQYQQSKELLGRAFAENLRDLESLVKTVLKYMVLVEYILKETPRLS